ncbi:hypothetical protein SAMN05444375_10188 [Segatella baroniae B14]|nr:hypothetical protein SAMN05444375_10188 [Segatella baroniae B14]
MKTPMKRTVFKVILRKSEYKEQWSLLIESFPVFEPGKDKPLRKHEPLGRFITTPIFDKNICLMARHTTGQSVTQTESSCVAHKKTKRLASLPTKYVTSVSTNTTIRLCTQIRRQSKLHKTKGQSATSFSISQN